MPNRRVNGIKQISDHTISIQPTNLESFFRVAKFPPSPFENSPILTSLEGLNGGKLSKDETDFFFYFSRVEDDLGAFLLHFCDISSRETFSRQQPGLQITISGKKVGAIDVQVSKVSRFFLF